METHAITFSMNGFRRNLHSDIKELKEQVMLVLQDEYFDKDDLAAAMDNVICASNSLNCVSLYGDKDFTLMEELYLPTVDEEAEQSGTENL